MNINPKYKIGDSVWTFDRYERGGPVQWYYRGAYMTTVTAMMYYSDYESFYYYIARPNPAGHYEPVVLKSESELFTDKDECYKVMIAHYRDRALIDDTENGKAIAAHYEKLVKELEAES